MSEESESDIERSIDADEESREEWLAEGRETTLVFFEKVKQLSRLTLCYVKGREEPVRVRNDLVESHGPTWARIPKWLARKERLEC